MSEYDLWKVPPTFFAGVTKPLADAAPNQWRATDGLNLELGATGYRIRRNTDARKLPFSVFDPEGREIGYGWNLPVLKAHAEEMASYMQEFEPPSPMWRYKP